MIARNGTGGAGSAWKRGASTVARAAPCDRVQGNNSNEMGGSDGIG
jgi:hypothetical protein